MDWTKFFFTLLVMATVVPAVLVVTSLNIVRAACWLLLSLSGAAGLFFFLGADFVGATQLLIYVGGTLVLVIFGVMLTATGPFVKMASRPGDWAMGIIGGFLLFGVLFYCLRETYVSIEPYPQPKVAAPATSNRIGMALMGMLDPPEPPKSKGIVAATNPAVRRVGNYVLPFIIISVHLVVVLIGAAYLARPKRRISAEA